MRIFQNREPALAEHLNTVDKQFKKLGVYITIKILIAQYTERNLLPGIYNEKLGSTHPQAPNSPPYLTQKSII